MALTPAKKVIPHQALLLCEHSHHDKSVQVNAFTEHPKVVTAHQVKMDELGHFTTNLRGKKESNIYVSHTHIHTHVCVCVCFLAVSHTSQDLRSLTRGGIWAPAVETQA